jgi:hypothetical protein
MRKAAKRCFSSIVHLSGAHESMTLEMRPGVTSGASTIIKFAV